MGGGFPPTFKVQERLFLFAINQFYMSEKRFRVEEKPFLGFSWTVADETQGGVLDQKKKTIEFGYSDFKQGETGVILHWQGTYIILWKPD